MDSFDLARFCSKPKRLCSNADMARGPAEIEPWLVPIRRRTEYWDPVIRPERSYTFARPAIAVAGHQTIPVEDASDQIITGDENELPDGREDIGGCRVALPSTALRQPHLAMNATGPMDQQDDLGGVIVQIGDNLMNERAHDALLQTRVGLRGRPDSFEIGREFGNIGGRQ